MLALPKSGAPGAGSRRETGGAAAEYILAAGPATSQVRGLDRTSNTKTAAACALAGTGSLRAIAGGKHTAAVSYHHLAGHSGRLARAEAAPASAGSQSDTEGAIARPATDCQGPARPPARGVGARKRQVIAETTHASAGSVAGPLLNRAARVSRESSRITHPSHASGRRGGAADCWLSSQWAAGATASNHQHPAAPSTPPEAEPHD